MRVFIDGFEGGGLDGWTIIGSNTTLKTSISGMDGTYCLYIPYSNSYAERDTPARDEYYVAFLYKYTQIVTSNCRPIFFKNNGTILGCLVRNNTSGYLEAYRGDRTTLLATGTTAININTTYLIEIRYKPHASAGNFEVKVNGISDISYSGQTSPSTVQINRIRLSFNDANATTAYYDNLIIDDAAWVGNTKIQALKPTAAGNATEWDPSTGSNWSCVDEVPPSASDFVKTNVSDETDLYTFGDLSGSIESIKCVQVQALAVKEGAPTPTNLKLATRTGGTTYVSGNNAVPAVTPAPLLNIWATNPNTSAAWSESEVNGAEFGIKSAA